MSIMLMNRRVYARQVSSTRTDIKSALNKQIFLKYFGKKKDENSLGKRVTIIDSESRNYPQLWRVGKNIQGVYVYIIYAYKAVIDLTVD